MLPSASNSNRHPPPRQAVSPLSVPIVIGLLQAKAQPLDSAKVCDIVGKEAVPVEQARGRDEKVHIVDELALAAEPRPLLAEDASDVFVNRKDDDPSKEIRDSREGSRRVPAPERSFVQLPHRDRAEER